MICYSDIVVEIDSEPEVSSSSEQILSASSQISVPPASQSTLEPFIVLTRCDSPLTEVTSSTAGDDIVDLIEEEKTDISTPKVTVILEDDSKPGNDIASTVKKSEEPIKLECDVDKKDIDKHCEEIDSGLGTSDQGQQSNSTKEERAQTPSENVSHISSYCNLNVPCRLMSFFLTSTSLLYGFRFCLRHNCFNFSVEW